MAPAATPLRDAAGPLERIAGIAKRIEGSGECNEALGSLTPEVVEALHAQRLFRLLLPRPYGGDEGDAVTWFRALEALGKLDGSTAWCVGQINGCGTTASALGPAVAHEIWDEPRAALGWGPPVKARAEEVDGGHRVTGQWMMASGSRHASWIGLMAPVFNRSGAPVALAHGAPTRMFVVPRTAVTLTGDWNVIGLRATNSAGFTASNLFVPDGYAMLHHHDLGAVIASPIYRFPLMSLFAIGFSGVALGIARAMLDAAVALAVEKKPRLAGLALRDNHLVQFQIGEAEARLRSARNYVETSTEQVWNVARASGAFSLAHRVDIRLAATFAIHEAKA